jgi:YebC/PmpR family DNA-binding regulatory protein
MSGHSKWSQIKRKKGVTDQKRGQIFTKIGRMITLASREGGADPESNFKLRLAIQKAKEVNMSKDGIDRAIKKGTGKLEGLKIEQISYEASGPAKTALIIEAVTDNRNRTTSEIRNVLVRHGARMAESGSFSWLFQQKGIIHVSGSGEEAELKIIDAEPLDFQEEDGEIVVYTKPNELFNIRTKLEEKGLEILLAELSLEPKETLKITDKKIAKSILKLVEELESSDDITIVYSNFDIDEKLMEEIV